MDGSVTQYTTPRGGLRVEEGVTFTRRGGWFVTKGAALCCFLFVLLILILAVLTTRYVMTEKNKHINETTADDDLSKKIIFLPEKLSGNVVPLKYKLMFKPYLDIAPDGEKTFELKGNVTILLEVKEATSSVNLHAFGLDINANETKIFKYLPEDLNITSTDFNFTSDKAYINIISQNMTSEKQLFSIEIANSLENHGKYVVELQYSRPITDSLQGIYKSSYIEQKSGQMRWAAVSQFQPNFAKQAFPCFDIPMYKTPYDISILRLSNMTTMSNADRKREEPTENGWIWDHYETSSLLSTDDVVMIVSNFEEIWKFPSDPSEKEISSSLSIWSRFDDVQLTSFAGDKIKRLMNFFTEYFGEPFPLSKLKLIAVPDLLPEATKSWGIITFRETSLLVNETSTPLSYKQNTLKTIVHELSNQWFGNSIKMNWSNDTWLSEGISTFMELFASNNVSNEWNMLDHFVTDVFQKGLLEESFLTVSPNPEQDSFKTSLIMKKAKGACVLRMLNNYLGDSALKNGIQHFFQEWKNKTVNENQFWNSLYIGYKKNETSGSSISEKNIKEIAESWINEMGYPVISVEYSRESGETVFKQKMYNLSNTNISTLWYIPITFLTKEKEPNETPDIKFWLKKEEAKTVTLRKQREDGWVIVNPEQIGFYRVNYDVENWNLLINELLGSGVDMISPATRAQLIDDAFQLARVGLLKYEIPLNLTKYLIQKEKSYTPWKAAIENIKFLDLFLWDSSDFFLFKNYVLNLIDPIYKALGNGKWDVEDSSQVLLRNLIIGQACKYEHPKCTEFTKQAFKGWMESKDPEANKIIEPDVIDVVICDAIRQGGRKELDFIWDVYKKANLNPVLQEIILKSMACSKTPWIINSVLSRILDYRSNLIRLQNIMEMWKHFSHNPTVGSIVFGFVKSHWQIIHKRFGPDMFDMIIKSSSRFLTTETQLAELEKFKNEIYVKEYKWNEGSEYVTRNNEWRRTQMASVINWLNYYNASEVL